MGPAVDKNTMFVTVVGLGVIVFTESVYVVVYINIWKPHSMIAEMFELQFDSMEVHAC